MIRMLALACVTRVYRSHNLLTGGWFLAVPFLPIFVVSAIPRFVPRCPTDHISCFQTVFQPKDRVVPGYQTLFPDIRVATKGFYPVFLAANNSCILEDAVHIIVWMLRVILAFLIIQD